MNLVLLQIAHPAYTVDLAEAWMRKTRYEAVTKNPAAPGLYAVITDDPDELNEILKAAAGKLA